MFFLSLKLLFEFDVSSIPVGNVLHFFHCYFMTLIMVGKAISLQLQDVSGMLTLVLFSIFPRENLLMRSYRSPKILLVISLSFYSASYYHS